VPVAAAGWFRGAVRLCCLFLGLLVSVFLLGSGEAGVCLFASMYTSASLFVGEVCSSFICDRCFVYMRRFLYLLVSASVFASCRYSTRIIFAI